MQDKCVVLLEVFLKDFKTNVVFLTLLFAVFSVTVECTEGFNATASHGGRNGNLWATYV